MHRLAVACGPNVLIVPGLPSQVSGVWGNWYQGYGRDGYPAIYLNLGEGKPVLRTKPVDDGKAGCGVNAASWRADTTEKLSWILLTC